eukprot:IDg5568t1
MRDASCASPQDFVQDMKTARGEADGCPRARRPRMSFVDMFVQHRNAPLGGIRPVAPLPLVNFLRDTRAAGGVQRVAAQTRRAS